MQYRNFLTIKNHWIFSPNTSIGEVSQYFTDFRTFQFKGRFISDDLIAQIAAAEKNFSSVQSALDGLTDIFINHMLPVDQWAYSRDQYSDNEALFAVNIGIIPFENPDGQRGENLSYTFQIFRNQSILDLVKHGRWLDDEVSGFEELNYYFARTSDLLKFRDFQTGLAGQPSAVFKQVQPFIDELNNQELVVRRIEAERSPSFLAVNLTPDFDNWESSGAAQLDKVNAFDVQSKISGLFPHVSDAEIAELKHKADIFKNLQRIRREDTVFGPDVYQPVRKSPTAIPKKYQTREIISVKRTLANAVSLLNIPFVWGGNDQKGLDIPGFVAYLRLISGLSDIGDKVYVQAASLRQAGRREKNYAQSLPGDLLFWGRKGAEFSVAMYIGGGQSIGLKGPNSRVQIQAVTGSPVAFEGIY
ncbi:NlpC/P60 family protein [Oenococcus kitaharae]|uniref:Cell wall-associated hydrolase n=1 Tax=Oenococcus kitaharae DSM 17330 TaxID=1045004 RepID=G9WGS3_9LACO|nr:NlpC/P60 family protein [Oenococcus kitaharae]EHN59900.1 cell wall-associated hydrolase [Oenococcus kitaharae DSM 17330]MCV3296655.1 C40 family peptidase [Oenococcus kitaharae]OEY82090.1 hydrolase [Oenococcus kitaharae]OEY82455.1 hydrolase [Oenococcus kitaharae]OEY83803.1 hydrolase [Oenococcus kitaharae]